MSDGQLAMNTNSTSPGLFLKDSAGNLVKVGPVHVGTTAPNASPATGGSAGNAVGEQWLDTSGSTYVFKIWDGSAWRSEAGEFVNVTGDVMTGALGIIAGSAGSPGLYFSGDTNTGLYSPGADQVAISTNGTQRVLIQNSSQDTVRVSGTNAVITADATSSSYPGFRLAQNGSAFAGLDGDAGNSTNLFTFGAIPLLFGTNGSERMRLDFSGRLGLGTSSPSNNLEVAVGAPSNNDSGITLSSTNNAGYGTSVTFAHRTSTGGAIDARSRISSEGGGNNSFMRFLTTISGTLAERMRIDEAGRVGINTNAPTATIHAVSADTAKTASFSGANGLCRIYGYHGGLGAALIEGSNIAENGRINLALGGDNLFFSTNGTERLRVTSDGYVRLSSSSPGIQFGGDTAAANALDDYEEGTFTPSIVGTSTAGTATYAANGRVGRYTKIGNRVFFDLYLSWTAHTGTGNLQIDGLPFTVQNTTNLNRNYTAIFSGVALTAGNIGAAYTAPGSDGIALRQMPTGGGSVAVIPMDTSAQISISGCFDAA
jgi:hypothetical protein